jgi:hypothetical protein
VIEHHSGDEPGSIEARHERRALLSGLSFRRMRGNGSAFHKIPPMYAGLLHDNHMIKPKSIGV